MGSTRWLVANLSLVDLSSNKLPDMEMVAISTALALSFASFIAIFMLDYVHDRAGEERVVGQALLKSIETIGVLVGFAWEQCFDSSIHSIASASTSPHIVRFVLALFSLFLVAPAWKIYLLPMAYHNGWKFGFVPTEAKIKDATSFFEEKQRKADVFKKNKEGHNHSHHHSLHHSHSSERFEEHGSTFSLMLEEDGASVLEENTKLKAQIQLIGQKCDALNAHCREHVAIMSSTVSGMVSPIVKLEEGFGQRPCPKDS